MELVQTIARSGLPLEQAPITGVIEKSVLQRRVKPLTRLCELSDAGWSGELVFALDSGQVRVWLKGGLLAWAEGGAQERSLRHVLCELLSIDRSSLLELAASWRARRLSLAEAVLAQPGMSEDKLRRALQEHLTEALSQIVRSAPCRVEQYEDAETSHAYATRWLFPLDQVLRPTRVTSVSHESLAELARRVYGASWVDLVVDGSTAGLSKCSGPHRGLLEASDALLFGHDDGVTMAVLRGEFGTWAGLPSAEEAGRASTWLAFDPEVPLGGAYHGLQAVCPQPMARAPLMPRSLATEPSLFPGAEGVVNYRAALASALALSEGALGAHVLERDVVCWGSLCKLSLSRGPFMDAMRRAASVLELCKGQAGRGLGNFVMVESAQGFHVGTRVRGTERTILMFSFAHGSSYGSSIAALAVGADALATALAAR